MIPKEIKEKCSDCYYWETDNLEYGIDDGVCRRYPPERKNQTYWSQATSNSIMWCGEWKQKNMDIELE